MLGVTTGEEEEEDDDEEGEGNEGALGAEATGADGVGVTEGAGVTDVLGSTEVYVTFLTTLVEKSAK